MRISNLYLAVLWAALAPALMPAASSAAGSAEAVALQYHFSGAAQLAENTNFALASKFLSLPPARRFRDLVLDRWAGVFWNALQLDPAGDSSALLRPMLNDLLQADSTGCFGGRDKGQMDFVLAARLDAKTAEAWQKNLAAALHASGEPLSVDGFSGLRWNRPGHHSLWLLRARDWTLAGRGEDLQAVRATYLQRIKQNNRPAPVEQASWLGAEVDWALLANWAPLAGCPLKLARTSVDVKAAGGLFYTIVHVNYPEAVPWKSQPWRIPKELVGGPLSSFTASQDVGAYLKEDSAAARLSGNPLTNQLFCWAAREMALQSYAAWPVADASNALRKLGEQAPAIVNPLLAARNHSQLSWFPKTNELVWTHLELTAPCLAAASDKDGDFLLAKAFPMESKFVKAPDQLWSQFQQRNDLVYYDWEITGLRLMQWRLLSEVLPVFPQPSPAEVARHPTATKNAKQPGLAQPPQTALAVTESWLAELSSPALSNTGTEVIRNSPTELTIVRNSQFLFTGLELVFLSHWLADAPVGPIDYTLLPMAKMSGPGLPRPR